MNELNLKLQLVISVFSYLIKYAFEQLLDFNKLRPHFFLFNNPMIYHISQQDDDIQLELFGLQSDPLYQKRSETGV